MIDALRYRFRPYALALLAVSLATIVRYALQPVLGLRYPFLPFFVAILFSAYFGGYVPAILAAVASWSCLVALRLIPAHYLAADATENAIAFAFFFTVAFTMVALGGALRTERQRVRRRELEVTRLREHRQADREWFRITLASISDAVITTDPAGRIISLNPVAERMTGWDATEAVGREVDQVLRLTPEPSAGETPTGSLLRGEAAVAAGRPLSLEHRDGSTCLVERSIAPIRDDLGVVKGAVVTLRDVSAQCAAQEALREADRRKDEFLVMLGHELRNPLAPIQSSLELMPHAIRTGADWMQDHAVALEQVRHLTSLVDNLLDVSRISHGRLELHKERVEVDSLIDRVVRGQLSGFGEKDLTLSVSRSVEPLVVDADATRLEQILASLLNNAARFTEPGGRVCLDVRRHGAELVVQVRDTGLGIRRELLPSIFELFVQADRRPGQVRAGLGIGLSLVRALVENHGGSIAAESDGPGTGSTFTIRLPGCRCQPNGTRVVRAHAPETSASVTGRPPSRAPAARRLRVLIVDDNRVAADSMARLLREGCAHAVHVSYDGVAALDAVEAFHPEVVLLDLDLPGIDGYEVARILRGQPTTRDLAIIAVSGWGLEENRRLSREAGIDQHLLKPVQFDALQQVLAAHCLARG